MSMHDVFGRPISFGDFYEDNHGYDLSQLMMALGPDYRIRKTDRGWDITRKIAGEWRKVSFGFDFCEARYYPGADTEARITFYCPKWVREKGPNHHPVNLLIDGRAVRLGALLFAALLDAIRWMQTEEPEKLSPFGDDSPSPGQWMLLGAGPSE